MLAGPGAQETTFQFGYYSSQLRAGLRQLRVQGFEPSYFTCSLTHDRFS
jgi:hypothetical protein